LARAVGLSLQQEATTAIISKQGDQPPPQKRLMQEAYGSYQYLLSAILKQLGFFARAKDRNREDDLVVQMVEQLRKIRSEDKHLLVILDDAQDISPGVWKRFQSWLDYQDRGKRMIQVLLVGSPMLKKTLGEPSLRSWRRWIHGRYELRLLSGRAVADETRRILKQACETIARRSQSEKPLVAPPITWFAVKRIEREAGGRPGRLTELARRALTASLREGGCRITSRFLSRADALRTSTTRLYKTRRPQPDSHERPQTKRQKAAPKQKVPAEPLGWMRYALGLLLVLFILGAGWGVTAWLSLPRNNLDEMIDTTVAEETATPADSDKTVVAKGADSRENAYSTPATDAVEDVIVDDLSESGSAESAEDPWGSGSSSDDGWEGLEPAETTKVAVESPVLPETSDQGDSSSSGKPVTGPVPETDPLAQVEAFGIQSEGPVESETPEQVADISSVEKLPTKHEESASTGSSVPETVSEKPSDTPITSTVTKVPPLQEIKEEKTAGITEPRTASHNRLRLNRRARKAILERLEKLQKTLRG